MLGTPEGIERLGGVDFDAAVYHHVASAIGPALDQLSPDDPAAVAAAARLRQECVDAKEALSADSDVSIPVLLPKLQTEVRLTRSEYEQMVRPPLADTITSLNRALRSAGVEPGEVTTVLLVGGSSRTPLVAELVSSALGRPVAVDAHPKYGVALGRRHHRGGGRGPDGGERQHVGDHAAGRERARVGCGRCPVGRPTAAGTRRQRGPRGACGARGGRHGGRRDGGRARPAALSSAKTEPAGAPTRAEPATHSTASPTGAPVTSPRAQPERPPAAGGATRSRAGAASTVGSSGRQRDPRSVMVPYGSDRPPPAASRPRHVSADDNEPPPRSRGRGASRRPVIVLSGGARRRRRGGRGHLRPAGRRRRPQ